MMTDVIHRGLPSLREYVSKVVYRDSNWICLWSYTVGNGESAVYPDITRIYKEIIM